MRTVISVLLLIPLMIGLASPAQGAPAALTYQGRIVKSDGTPFENSNVSFLFQITDPSGACIIYQEKRDGYSMVNSKGVFDVPIGTGSVQYPPGKTILDVFNNSASFFCGNCSYSGSSYTCSATTTPFSPTINDGRLLRVSFFDGSGWKTIRPDNIIRSVPFAGYAVSAQKLGTNVAADFLLKAGLPDCSASGGFLTYDGTNLSCQGVTGAAGGTVKTVTASGGSSPYLSVSADTVNPVVTLNVGQAAGTVAAGDDSRILGALQKSGGTMSGDLILADRKVVFQDAAIKTVSLQTPAALTNSYVLRLPTDQGAANTVLQNDGAGNLSWAALDLTHPSSVSGALPIAHGGTNSTTALNNNRIMASVGGAIKEAAAITPNKALVSDANGIPTASSISGAELQYLSGVTSGIQTQLNDKVTASGWSAGSVIAASNTGVLTSVGGTVNGSILQAGPAGTTPTWSAASFPSSTTANQLLYSSANNVVGGLATANNAVLTTNASGTPGFTAISGDLFSQYALLSGRSSGQTLNGGTSASESLTLDSTSNPTKGNIILAPSGGRVGIGTTTPGQALTVAGTIESTVGGIKFPDGTTQTTAATSVGGNDVSFHVTKSSSQALSAGVIAAVSWQNKVLDTGNYFNLGTGRFQPTEVGRYLIHFSIATSTNMPDGGNLRGAIVKNGTTIASRSTHSSRPDEPIATTVTALVDLDGVSDYVEFHVSTGSSSQSISNLTYLTFAQGFKIGGAGSGSDNMGNHIASQDINLNGQKLVNASSDGLFIDTNGRVGIGTLAPTAKLEVAGSIKPGSSGVTIGAACTGEGALAYDATNHKPVFCSDAGLWTAMSAGGGGLGVGQSWQNVKASRAFGTNYTNSTGKPIQVSVTGVVTGYCGITAIVNGVSVGTEWSGAASYTQYVNMTFIVPDGSIYSVTNESGTCSLDKWTELR